MRSLELTGHVSVMAGDVKQLGESSPGSFEAVTARSFAAPPITVHWAGVLLRPGGRLVVSEPPADDDDRWPAELLAAAGLIDQGRDQGVRVFLRR